MKTDTTTTTTTTAAEWFGSEEKLRAALRLPTEELWEVDESLRGPTWPEFAESRAAAWDVVRDELRRRGATIH